MPPINLLPREVAARQRERRIFQAALGAGAVVVAVLVVFTLVGRAREARERDALRAEQDQVNAVRADVARLQQFEDLSARVEQRKGTLAAALTADVAWSKFLNDVSLIMPDNSWLTSLALSAAAGAAPNGVPSFATVTFSGFTFDFPGLAGWLTRMTQIEGLTFVYLSSGQRQELSGQRVVQFGANANINQSLLSRRCQPNQRCP